MLSQVFVFIAVFGISVAQYLPVHAPHHHIEHHAPKPYAFGYSIKDHHGEQHREESGHGGAVKGSYGFTDARGVHRQVEYVADGAGFRATVKTNEPGTANQNPAAVHIMSDAPHALAHDAGYLQAIAPLVAGNALGLGGLGYAGLGYAGGNIYGAGLY